MSLRIKRGIEMSDRKIFYISIGFLLLGVFLFGWGALSDSTLLTTIGAIAFGGSIVFRSFWWLKKMFRN
jgi:hypothetical protein